MSLQTYTVEVERIDEAHAQAKVRGFTLDLGARRADMDAGFNPVETLLSAMGDCLLTALDFVAELSHASINGASIALEATRQDKPPLLVGINYTLRLRSDLPDERLERLVALAQSNSTVFQTVSKAVPVEGRWERAG